ncbi:MAG: TetR/AcrR family transcriptional regulator [Clostridiales bacterium]|nr:TetR/AcrR family transcriptional regulator [Clostridiales bacterium]
MVRDKKAHHDMIMKAAFEEFRTHGFPDASMRRIASAAGMSASGLYKHFESKEEMFSALVDPAIDGMMVLYEDLARKENETLNLQTTTRAWEDQSSTSIMLDYIYSHLDAFKLIICSSQGTRYANFVHDIALMEEKNTREYIANARRNGFAVNEISDEEMHLLVTMNINAVVAAVEHDFSKDQAKRYAKTLEKFFIPGWRAVLGI